MLKSEKLEFSSKSDLPCVGLYSKYWEHDFHQAILKIILGSSLVAQGVKDLMSLQQLGLLLQCEFDLWLENFHMPQAQPKRKNHF